MAFCKLRCIRLNERPSEAISSRPFTGYSATSVSRTHIARQRGDLLHRPQNEEVHQHVQQYEHPQEYCTQRSHERQQRAVCAGQRDTQRNRNDLCPMTSFNTQPNPLLLPYRSTIVAGAAAGVE